MIIAYAKSDIGKAREMGGYKGGELQVILQ